MIQNLSLGLSQQDKTELRQIITNASKELRTSSTDRKTALNILPVLAAYRKVNGSFHSPVYQAILSIAHSHNPQTSQQWMQAIESLSHRAQHSQRHSTDPNKSKYKHRPNHSHAHIALPNSTRQDMSWLTEEGKEVDTSTQPALNQTSLTHSRPLERTQNYTLKETPHSTIEDKENTNQTNFGQSRQHTTLQYIQALQNYAQPPCNSPQPMYLSSGHSSSPSPVASFLQPTSEPLDPDEVTAETYHQYNLLLKGFSSLLAHHMVHQQVQKNQEKADNYYQSKAYCKGFSGLKNAVVLSHKRKEMESKAEVHLRSNVLTKCFNLLKFLRGIKVREQREIKASQINHIGINFILNLVVSMEEVEGEQLKETSQILLHEQRVQQMCQLVRYFGRYPCALSQPIQRTLQLQQKVLLHRSWKALMANRSQAKQHSQIHDSVLVKRAWSVLLRRWAGIRSLKVRAMARNVELSRMMKQSVMKTLCEMAYSQQVYSKRCQFISAKADHLKKVRTLQMWQDATLTKISKQDELTRKGHSAGVFLQRFSLRIALNCIEQESEYIEENTQKIMSSRLRLWLLRLKQSTIAKHNEQRVLEELHQMVKQTQKRHLLRKWYVLTKQAQGARRVTQTTKKYLLRTEAMPVIEELIFLSNASIALEGRIKKKAWSTWSRQYADSLEELKQKEETLSEKVRNMRLYSAIASVKYNKKLTQEDRRKNQIAFNSDSIRQIIITNRQARFFQKLVKVHESTQKIHTATKSLERFIIKSTCAQVIRNLSCNHQINNKIKAVVNETKFNAMRLIKGHIQTMKVHKIEGTIQRRVLLQLSQRCTEHKTQSEMKMNKAIQHYQRCLAIKSVQSLGQLVAQRQQVESIYQESVNRKRRVLISKALKSTRQVIMVQQMNKKISKIMSLRRFAHRHSKKKKTLEVQDWVKDLWGQRAINSIRTFWSVSTTGKRHLQQRKYLQKSLFFMRLHDMAFRALIERKQRLMLYKFRAERVSRGVMRHWKTMVNDRHRMRG